MDKKKIIIEEKKVDNNIYKLGFFPGDKKYVVYKLDETMKGIQFIPEVARFDNEEDAKSFFKKL